LIAAKSYVDSGIAALRSGEFSDAAASEIELALARVGELDGKAVAEEVVAEIFSKFCVGK
jgi:tRNA U34 5-carboxymethylaminomethyl modifying GTPase MnmE/TrmE